MWFSFQDVVRFYLKEEIFSWMTPFDLYALRQDIKTQAEVLMYNQIFLHLQQRSIRRQDRNGKLLQ